MKYYVSYPIIWSIILLNGASIKIASRSNQYFFTSVLYLVSIRFVFRCGELCFNPIQKGETSRLDRMSNSWRKLWHSRYWLLTQMSSCMLTMSV